MAGRRVHFVFPEELLLRVDGVLGSGQSRGEWVRWAVERALDESSVSGGRGARGRSAGEVDATLSAGGSSVVSPAPAEQPEWSAGDVADVLGESVVGRERELSRVEAFRRASRR